MRKARHSEEQIVGILREAESGKESTEALCRRHGITAQTFYRWRARFGGLEPSDAARLRELERENARLKKIVADRSLEIEILKEIAAKKW